MHTIRMYYGAADGLYIYIVGFQHSATATKFDPIVACDTLGNAMTAVCFLNGGPRPADNQFWLNVMQPRTPATAEVTVRPGDFKRGNWVMPEEA